MKKIILSLCFLGIVSVSFAQTYTYDNNHQVVEIKHNNNIVEAMQYDANGNRIIHSITGSPLPVSLLSFNAQKSAEQVLLTWSTSTEINSDKFNIEYSKDGNSFSSFITVPANGNSSTRLNYSTIHCCPVEGVNFYRLKMIDRDGSFKYSEIRKVVFEFINVMKLYPNPNARDKDLTISFKKSFTKDGTINIYNTIGALVYSSLLNKGETVKAIKTGNFAAGKYSVVVDVDGKLYKDNFIKQ